MLAACYRTSSPPPPRGEAPSPPTRASACVLVGTVHDDVKIGPGGDRIISDYGRLAVLDVDVASGATRSRVEVPLDAPLHVRGVALRGAEVVLQILDVADNFQVVPARIDLTARRLELGEPDKTGDPRAAGALASDGRLYYRSCVDRSSHRIEMCRGTDWEVRGAGLEPPLEEDGFFDAIAVADGELYAVDDRTAQVFELASGQRMRELAIAHGADDGAGIVGDDLVVLDDTTLARFDRRTGEPRGSVQVSLANAAGLRLTCR